MTYAAALTKAEAVLEKAGVGDSRYDARALLYEAAGLNLTQYLLKKEQEMPEAVEERYETFIRRRSLREPLQHITGHTEFMGLDFLTGPEALIPRQDTELLVQEAEQALKKAARHKNPRTLRAADVCTGTGCIGISLAKRFPGPSYIACDLSDEALDLAKRNAGRLQAEIAFLQGDLLEPLTGLFDLIVSNPPYIREGDIPGLETEVRDHDPYLALSGGEDGLELYRRLIPQAAVRLVPGGTLLMEIGFDQAEDTMRLMEKAGFSHLKVQKDLAGLDRIVGGIYV